MSPGVALLIYLFCSLWVLRRDLRLRGYSGIDFWLPFLWLLIIGSRPISQWFAPGATTMTDVSEGSPLDRNIFTLLMVGAGIVCFRRNVDIAGLLRQNAWVLVLFTYNLLSVIWSDYSFVAFKRWSKDLGNLLMVVLVLSGGQPFDRLKLLFNRVGFILIPLSLCFIKYFPDYGRYYNPWTWTYNYGGVANDKNMLGMTLAICGFFVAVSLLEAWKTWRQERLYYLGLLSVLLINLWLLRLAASSTATAGFVLALGLVAWGHWRKDDSLMRTYAPVLGATCVLSVILAMAGSSIFSFFGRDASLTGRTEIWQKVLSFPVNRLVGTGFDSFWLYPEHIDAASSGLYFHLREAHSGYIETLLNTGVIGLVLLLLLIFRAFKVLAHSEMSKATKLLPLAALALCLVYNVTESTFNRLTMVWFCLLAVVLAVEKPAHMWRSFGHPILGERGFSEEPLAQEV